MKLSITNVLLFLFLITAGLTAQQAGNMFPSEPGDKWFFRNTPLDSLENPMDSLSFIRVDTFATKGDYYDKNSNIFLTKAGIQSTLPFQPFIDSLGYAVEGNVIWQRVDLNALTDTSLIPDTSIVNVLLSLQGWYPVYDFDKPLNNDYLLVQKDTTLTINDTEVPFRVQVTAERKANETISTILGDIECAKFTIVLRLGYLVELPPPLPPLPVYFLQYPINQWLYDGNFVVEEYSPSINVDLSFFGLPAFYVPGRISKKIEQPAYLVLDYPMGGEVFYNGENIEVLWRSWFSENLTLEVSPDSGDSWTTIADNITAEDESYNWVVPLDAVSSENYVFRVSSNNDDYATDRNDDPVLIRKLPDLEVTYPAAADTLEPGESYDLTWTSENLVQVNILYSTDFVNWTLLEENFDATTGSLNFTAPDPGNMIFRFTDTAAPFEEFYSDTLAVVAVSDLDNEQGLPTEFALYNNYPNPFNPTTTIKFDVAENAIVKLEIYDILGRVVGILTNKYYNAGTYSIRFDAANLNSGVYFYRLTSGKNIMVKKMILTK